MTQVTVVVVNFNGGAEVLACLSALRGQTRRAEIVVVDNASSDDSQRAIRAGFPDLKLLPLRRNTGFARAVNIAAQRVDGDVLVTLNPDTVPEPQFIERLVAPLERDQALGSVAGTLVFASDPTIVASAGIRVHRDGVALDDRLGERRDESDEATRPVFGASGGAAAYRLRAFRSSGGFCESFFLYLEDVDLAWRLRLLGWDSVNAPDARATHAYSLSSVEGSPFKRRMLARNRVWSLARSLPIELWRRDRRAIVAFDILAASGAIVRRDAAALAGRTEAIACLPLRLRERRLIQSARLDAPGELSSWVQPAIGPRRLLELRRLTARMAGSPGV